MNRIVKKVSLTWGTMQQIDLPTTAILLNVQQEVSIFNNLLAFFLVDPDETEFRTRTFELFEVDKPFAHAPGMERNLLAIIQNRGKIISVFERIN